jgi:hypothetical protein
VLLDSCRSVLGEQSGQPFDTHWWIEETRLVTA